MGRSPCCDKMGLKKGPWTSDEDGKLLTYIQQHGHGNWHALPSKAGLRRCGKSCRLRWANYLRPDIKRGKFSLQEDETIIQLHALLGNRWSAIAAHLPKRTDNEIKNYYNTHLKKRLTKMGIDPVTHKPKSQALAVAQSSDTATTNIISHMAQWETARLEAEARSKSLDQSSINPNHHLPDTTAWTNPGKHISNPTVAGYFSQFPAVGSFNHNHVGACTAVPPNDYYRLQDDRTKGIVGNSAEFHHDHTSVNPSYCSLGFPSFIGGFTDVGPSMGSSIGGCDINGVGGCWGVTEEEDENSYYWGNVVNVISTPVDARLWIEGKSTSTRFNE